MGGFLDAPGKFHWEDHWEGNQRAYHGFAKMISPKYIKPQKCSQLQKWSLRGNLQKKTVHWKTLSKLRSIFAKFIFDKVLIMLTSLPPSPRKTQSPLVGPDWIINHTKKSASIFENMFYDPLPLQRLSKNYFFSFFWNGVDLLPFYSDNVFYGTPKVSFVRLIRLG